MGLIKLPVSEIRRYDTLFSIDSTLSLELVDAFVNRRPKDDAAKPGSQGPVGLEDSFLPPPLPNLYCISSDRLRGNEVIAEEFGFCPVSHLNIEGMINSAYLRVDASQKGEVRKVLQTFTKETIRRFMALSDREGARTVIFPDGKLDGRVYCSANLLGNAVAAYR